MFRGQYTPQNSSGTPFVYSKGDDVLFQGKIYSCSYTTSLSPIQEPKSWKITGLSENYSGSNPPLNPIENQIWISDSGKEYVYYKDSDGYQWIEI